MKDILLEDGDIYLNEDGDIMFTDSIVQAVNIRLQWFYDEWIFAPDKGVKYYESIFVKNPDISRIKILISEQIGKVDGVKIVKSVDIETEKQSRKMNIRYVVVTESENLRGEVELWNNMELRNKDLS